MTISQTIPLCKQEVGHRGKNQKKRDDNKGNSHNIIPASQPHAVFKKTQWKRLIICLEANTETTEDTFN